MMTYQMTQYDKTTRWYSFGMMISPMPFHWRLNVKGNLELHTGISPMDREKNDGV